MKISHVTYRRVVSANFQSQGAEVTVALEKGDTVEKATLRAKKEVHKILGLKPSEAEFKKAKELVSEWSDEDLIDDEHF